MQQTILAISGKPGLYKLVSRGKMNLIVESLDASHKRMPAFATDRVTSLSDIAMYTYEEDVPRRRVRRLLLTIRKLVVQSFRSISGLSFLISTVSAFTQAILRSSSSGMISS